MLILTHLVPHPVNSQVSLTLPLTAEQRMRSRQRLNLGNGEIVHLKLPRGTILKEGDILEGEQGHVWVKITAKLESVVTVTANNNLALLKAAYHLGNRHIPLEITENYLRFPTDPVLVNMVNKLGLRCQEEISPFYPEIGAYQHSH